MHGYAQFGMLVLASFSEWILSAVSVSIEAIPEANSDEANCLSSIRSVHVQVCCECYIYETLCRGPLAAPKSV